MKAQLLIHWQTAAGRKEPVLPVALPAQASLMDVTGEQAPPLAPGALVVEVWSVTQAYLDACVVVEPGCVLWSENETA